ncbi:mRNA splicing protein [Coemansia sp. Benny D115]|nr:mRNA splicing protein [Coemansia sp. Benny D115]
MSSVSDFLPEPKHKTQRADKPAASSTESATALTTTTASEIPALGHRIGWVPKTPADFGDGGAYPELRLLQYPLGMGRKRTKQGNALQRQVDSEGNASYEAIARHGRRETEIVQSTFKELVPLRQRKDFADGEEAIPSRPDASVVQQTAERTKSALERILGGRIEGTSKSARGKKQEPEYVRYTPNQQAPGFNSGAKQRVVRVTQMPVDPMEPPKVRSQKTGRKPASPPAPVMHSPPRKLTAEEQREWVIPPCVSNWKNIHGFTVSLDKRLAADGRGLEETHVSDGFARLSEALGAAESHARAEIAERAQVQQSLAQREKQAREERLRMLAQRAREERAAAKEGEGSYVPPPMHDVDDAQDVAAAQTPASDTRRSGGPVAGRKAAVDFFDSHTPQDNDRSAEDSRGSADDQGMRERDELRRERRRQHERDQRVSRNDPRQARRSETRDISEKIALGIAKPTGARESLFDSRLFDQASASNAQLQNDEAYNLYDKPLFNTQGAGNYRPRALDGDQDEAAARDVKRLMESDRFGGALEGPSSKKRLRADAAPVQFEKGDVFGIDAFVGSARPAAPSDAAGRGDPQTKREGKPQ